MVKTDDNIREDISAFDMMAEYGGWLVAIGLGIEVFLAFLYRGNKPFLEEWGPVVVNGLIALGVVTEVYFTRLSSAGQSELDRRSEEKVAAANERAANALRESERMKAHAAWRRLTEEQHRGLKLALDRNGQPASVRFTVLANDAESLYFAQQISIPFKAARWDVGYSFELYNTGIFTGILLPEPNVSWLEEMTVVNDSVRAAFIAADIRFVNGWPLGRYMHTESIYLHTPTASVYVGPKPMPPI